MSANKQGIQLEKHQIKALLAFTGGDKERPQFGVVRFRVSEPGTNLFANATDGHRAIQAVFEATDPHCVVGEWAVDREFLGDCCRSIKRGEVLLLRVKKNGLREAAFLNGETLEEKRSLKVPTEAAATQMTFDTVFDVMKIAQDARRLTGSWYAVQGRFHSDVAIVAKACGNKSAAVSIYPPAAPDQPIGFEAKSDGVTWTGVLMPIRVEAPGAQVPDEGDDGDDSDDEPAGDTVQEAVESLKDVLKEHGATMTLTTDGAKVSLPVGDEGAAP